MQRNENKFILTRILIILTPGAQLSHFISTSETLIKKNFYRLANSHFTAM